MRTGYIADAVPMWHDSSRVLVHSANLRCDAMTNDPTEPLEAELIFSRSESARSTATWCLVGGVAASGFAVVGFCLALITRIGHFAMQSITTVPMLLGIGLLAAARVLSRTPTQVSVGPQGVCIEDRRGQRRYCWADIGWAGTGTTTMGFRRQLTLYDTRGKAIASLSDAFDGFDSLVAHVQSHIAGKADTTAAAIQKRKGRKSAVFVAAVALILAAVSVANLWMAFEEQRTARLLQEAGVPGEAEIVRRFVAPNGVTRRLEYRVIGAGGQTGTRNAEVTPAYWDSLEGAKTVPVIYVPQEPAVSRLAEGEVESRDFADSPGVMIGLSVLLIAMCVVFLAAAVMQWCGWDIDLDSKTGRISITRFGAGR